MFTILVHDSFQVDSSGIGGMGLERSNIDTRQSLNQIDSWCSLSSVLCQINTVSHRISSDQVTSVLSQSYLTHFSFKSVSLTSVQVLWSHLHTGQPGPLDLLVSASNRPTWTLGPFHARFTQADVDISALLWEFLSCWYGHGPCLSCWYGHGPFLSCWYGHGSFLSCWYGHRPFYIGSTQDDAHSWSLLYDLCTDRRGPSNNENTRLWHQALISDCDIMLW